ncbi:hypothetical protein ACTFIW_006907 [Dictyostelium discoideum]
MNNNIKLNELIFNEIEPLLIYKCSFQRILELSLLSKSIFKKIQYQITNQQKEIKFKPEINEFLNYIYNFKKNDINKFNSYNKPIINNELISTILNNNNNNNNNYKFKLIQFKEIENLNCINNNGSYQAKQNNENIKTNLKRICKNLKTVYYSNYFPIDTLDEDPTIDNFFNFEKVELYWDCDESPPESFIDECDNQDDYQSFNYSFEFLKRYKSIKKISIRTVDNESNLHLKNLNNIFKHINNINQLNKIQFNYQNTSYNFLINEKLNNIKNLNSFSIRLGNFGLNIINEENEENEENEDLEILNEIINNNCENTSKLIEIIFKNIKLLKNNKLRKLIINKCHSDDNEFNSPNSNNPSEFLKLLLNDNYSIENLRILGLAVYDLTNDDDFKLLSELINKNNNINQLITNIQSFEQFLKHCNENKNIEILKISLDKYSDNLELLNNINWENILNLINNNKSLKSIYLYNNDQFNENLQLLNNLNSLKNNNKNNNLSIKILNNFN